MKTVLTALVLALSLAGAAQASTAGNGDLPGWAVKAFTKVH